MFKTKRFLLILAIICAFALMFSCSPDEEENNGNGDDNKGKDFEVSGIYYYEQTTGSTKSTTTWDFQEKGVFELIRGANSNKFTGKWSVKGSELTIALDSVYGTKPAPDVFKASSSSDDEITLEGTTQTPAVFSAMSYVTSNKITLKKGEGKPEPQPLFVVEKNTSGYDKEIYYVEVDNHVEIVNLKSIGNYSTGDYKNFVEYVIPERINGKNVTVIQGNKIIANHSSISLVIPYIRRIEDHAFGIFSIYHIIIGANVDMGYPGFQSPDFGAFYNKNGKKAGKYTQDLSNSAYKIEEL